MTLLDMLKYMISISVYLFLLEIYSNYYYTFSKIDSKSMFLRHLTNCGLGENLVYMILPLLEMYNTCDRKEVWQIGVKR